MKMAAKLFLLEFNLPEYEQSFINVLTHGEYRNSSQVSEKKNGTRENVRIIEKSR